MRQHDKGLDDQFKESSLIQATKLNERLEAGWQIIHTSQCTDTASVNALFVLYRPDASLELDEILLRNMTLDLETLEAAS